MEKIKIKSLVERINDGKPKRILSLDGGGTKGIVTIAMLEKLEVELKNSLPRTQIDGFRLNQFFDYIGGTSTGSIIAVLISLGYSITKIKELYLTFSRQIFNECEKRGIARFIPNIPLYSITTLEKYLAETLGELQLKDPSILNLLAIFTKNTASNNIWTFNNNPHSKYYDHPPDNEEWYPNKEQYLRDLVRASTAAPIYFLPKKLKIELDKNENTKTALFIDGGVSMENNPSFRLFLMATIPAYHLGWKIGQEQLLVTSFGTGQFTQKYNSCLISILKELSGMYINNASQTTDMIMRGLSYHNNLSYIDSELNDIKPSDLNNLASLSYFRYNFNFRKLKDKYNIDINEKASWAEMDNPKNMTELYDIVQKGFEIDIKDIPQPFLDVYYDWEGRIIDGNNSIK